MARMFTGDIRNFSSFAAGEPHQDTISYVQESLNRLMADNHLNVDILNRAVAATDNFINGTARRFTRAVARQIGGLFAQQGIRTLISIGDFQAPPTEMIPYVMLQEDIYNRYAEQRCDGYSGEYINVYSKLKRTDNPLYHQVMDGILQEQEDELVFVEYSNSLIDPELRALNITEQSAILNTWERLTGLLVAEDNEDPTSRFNASLR